MYIDWNGREQEDPEMDAMREDAREARREASKQAEVENARQLARRAEVRKAAKLVRAFFAGIASSEVGQNWDKLYANSAQFEPPSEGSDDSHTTPPPDYEWTPKEVASHDEWLKSLEGPLDYVDPSWTPPRYVEIDPKTFVPPQNTWKFEFILPLGMAAPQEEMVKTSEEFPGVRLIYFLHTLIHLVMDAPDGIRCSDLHNVLIQEAFKRRLVTKQDIARFEQQREHNR